jgi:uncharacterized protein (DUF2249 family)
VREEEMAVENEVTMDVRDLPPWERHPKIFGALEALAVGQTLVLVNDHEPKPLYYQLLHERPDKFQYTVEQKGPREWAACFRKVA